MSPQRRTALVSVAAAVALIALKLSVGLVTHSLGLISEALHSGTDLVAALLTFYAVGYSVRPADRGHHYGHGKAEHLSALAEATILVAASFVLFALSAKAVKATAPAPVVTQGLPSRSLLPKRTGPLPRLDPASAVSRRRFHA